MTAAPLRIAMWSGPRNISTAMMRSFENRPDCYVTDEPLYAHYLQASGAPHPMREAVIASQPTDWRTVVAWLTGPVPDGSPIWYQKHMTHHLLPEIGREWMRDVENCFLIRDPRAVLASYARKRQTAVTAEDVGIPQQLEIFEYVRALTAQVPPVVDAADVLRDPRAALGLLCERLGAAFREEMLSWPPGRRATDGVWAVHWYHAVERSTGFEPYRPEIVQIPAALAPLARACEEPYRALHAHRLRP
ncbi:MAG: HAD family hydrolase [Gammaproteobacteria bacterium]|nr:HAD family hydrolase [Gammaproteobacteria bacterium]NIR84050.1 HAD family hydrolase [Gammaproteobacteria bacterium]NIR89194.1 HAD family hydrolase [Gammaproteobacteria bacterium]NIU04996.1 HAD family hydrolase [Gammaproteobacteria bacterium]NIV52162.1 HAD family hydrolase [Gammaproteobacteria bacterium]